MKKILIIAICMLAGCQSKKSYLKNETYCKHVNGEVFLSKLQAPLPQWMQEQLEENFEGFEKGISKEQVEATFAQIQKVFPTSYIVRYHIWKNELYRYFRDGEPISLKDNSTERAIKTLMQYNRLPDCDFMVAFFDGIRPNHVFFHNSMQAPLFISAKIKKTPFIVLIPDWRSLGEWWAGDLKAVKACAIPWEAKKEFAIWRGAYNREERKILCRLSLEHPKSLDAQFDQFISWEKFLECKYLPYVDGYMTASPALQWRLLSGSITFKPETNEVQWYHRALIPYVHYIPLKADLSDLMEKLDWAKEHDTECKQIAENAKGFALENLMFEDVLLYFNAVIQRYGVLQKGIVKEKDPHWVRIQYRSKLRTEISEPTPGCAIINTSENSPTP